METKEIIGIVQTIKENRKSFTINKIWYNSYIDLSEDIKIGSKVKVTYLPKKVNNKIFNNIKDIEIIGIEESEKQKFISDSTTNTLIMTATEIFIAIEGKKTLKEVTKDVIESYKEIRDNISK